MCAQMNVFVLNYKLALAIYLCCNHTFWETNSLRRIMQIVEVQFITPESPRQSLLLAKDPNQFF